MSFSCFVKGLFVYVWSTLTPTIQYTFSKKSEANISMLSIIFIISDSFPAFFVNGMKR